jgi:hypothetical protein
VPSSTSPPTGEFMFSGESVEDVLTPSSPPQISVPAPAVQDSPKGKGKAVAAPSISDDGIDTPDSTE